MLKNFKRIVRAGFINFWRNGVVSLASILVMVATLFVIGLLMFGKVSLDSALTQLNNKVDINVYFLINAPESNILSLKKSLENLAEVSSVEYVSREQALENFKDRHKNDQLTMQAVEAVDGNPLGAILNIKAKETSQYESIAKFLDSSNALSSNSTSIIDKVNYFKNKPAIDRLSGLMEISSKIGIFLAVVLIIISIIITFNTIRLAIYISREEISVMKLVGASNSYIRGPFIIEGMMYGLVAAILTLVLFYPLVYKLGPLTEYAFNLNLFTYYFSNFGQIFGVIVFSGILLGALASYLAVRKYLKV